MPDPIVIPPVEYTDPRQIRNIKEAWEIIEAAETSKPIQACVWFRAASMALLQLRQGGAECQTSS